MKKNDCKWEEYKLTHWITHALEFTGSSPKKRSCKYLKDPQIANWIVAFCVWFSATPTPKSQSAEEEEQEANNPKSFNGVAHSSVPEFSESQSP
jgi:hypothetical protein